METDGGKSTRPRKRRFLLTLVVAVVFGLGVGWFVERSSKPSVEPLVEKLKVAGFMCDPPRKSNDGIMNSFSICQKENVRLEISSQPTDQAHDELVRFTVEDMGCPLALSRNHPGFTLYTRGRTIVYEFGNDHGFAELFDEFGLRDVECKKEAV